MNILYRAICFITVVFVVAGFCVSCFVEPFKAHADELDILTSVFAYEDEFRESLITVNRAANDAVNDSNISSESKAKIRAVLALQELALRTMPSIYGNPTNPILPDSDTVTFSGTASSGLYKSEIDNQTHIVTLCPPPAVGNYSSSLSWTFASSDEFNATLLLTSSSDDYPVRVDSTHFNDGSYFPNYYNGYADIVIAIFRGDLVLQSDSYFSGFTHSEYRYGQDIVGFSISNENRVPTLSRNLTFALGNVSSLGASGISATLPNQTVDTEEPWSYYNDYLLPEMRQDYPDVPDIFFAFPQGYYPAPAPDPTEPPSFPNGGINIDKQYNIGINIIFPTDANGQPVTDASGETVTETEYITDTNPLDGEYSFMMPTLPHLTIYDATLPNPDVSAYTDGIGFIWNACFNILTSTGFMPVVMICFALALFGFILWKLGG